MKHLNKIIINKPLFLSSLPGLGVSQAAHFSDSTLFCDRHPVQLQVPYRTK